MQPTPRPSLMASFAPVAGLVGFLATLLAGSVSGMAYGLTELAQGRVGTSLFVIGVANALVLFALVRIIGIERRTKVVLSLALWTALVTFGVGHRVANTELRAALYQAVHSNPDRYPNNWLSLNRDALYREAVMRFTAGSPEGMGGYFALQAWRGGQTLDRQLTNVPLSAGGYARALAWQLIALVGINMIAAGLGRRRPLVTPPVPADDQPVAPLHTLKEDWELEHALGAAAGHGDWQRVLALLRMGADPHGYCQARGMSVLAYAARRGQYEVVEAIVGAGVRPSTGYDPEHTSPLCQAILGGRPQILRLLIRATWNLNSQRDADQRSVLMFAVAENVAQEVICALLQGLRFDQHSAEEQAWMREAARRHHREDLLALFSLEDPVPVPEVTRQARVRDIKDIELGRKGGEGVSFLPRCLPECIDFHDIDGRGRSNVGYAKPPWALNAKDRELLADCGAQWFDPFIDKLCRGQSFTLEGLQEAHLAATGKPLRVNTIQS